MIEATYIDLLRIIVDSGLLVLAWLVQLVIYPSFLYYQKTDLDRWHPIYTRGITWVVLPLMVSQLSIAVYQCIEALNLFSVIYGLFVVLTWGITFVKAVPLHGQIETNATPVILKDLIRVHSYRTTVWTFLLGWSCYSLF